jgi:hypothetical protein
MSTSLDTFLSILRAVHRLMDSSTSMADDAIDFTFVGVVMSCSKLKVV